ncbi:MAG: hypothetical protein HKP27_14145 [Myxococcales bacterium]|nr:hypothetical protein [Myxococcales bacterium]
MSSPIAAEEHDPKTSPPQRFAGILPDRDVVELRPRLADRDVVTRPERPFQIVPGGSLTGFVGSPLWLALGLENDAPPIVEFPLLRPSDTWFGANSREGELCYASRTRLRLRRADVEWTPHRAVSEVKIRNSGRTPLRVERMNVPVPSLSLWVDETGMLQTSRLSFTRTEDDEIAEMEIDPGIPLGAELVARPRIEPRGGLVRAFSQLL